jgi:hypothetical protein
MKIINLIKVLFVLLIITNCSKNERIKDTNVVTIEVPEDYSQNLLEDSLIENLRIIPLETNNQCLISNIEQMFLYKNKYYIHDYSSMTLFVFDSTGKFLFKINAVGNGPGEYAELTDVKIDKNGEILILYYMQILRYDNNGKYLNTVNFSHLRNEKNGFFPFQFVPAMDGGFYFWTGTVTQGRSCNFDHYALYRVNDNATLISKEIKMERANYGYWNRFYRISSNCYYMQSIEGNDTIYSISTNGVIPTFFIDFGENSMPKDYLPKGYGHDVGKKYFDIANSTNYCSEIHDIAENKNYLWFSFRSGKINYSVLYSKHSKKLRVGKLFSLLTPGIVYTSNPNTDEIVLVVNGEGISYVLETIKKNKNIEYSDNEKKIIDYINTLKDKYDNPFLIAYKIKEF